MSLPDYCVRPEPELISPIFSVSDKSFLEAGLFASWIGLSTSNQGPLPQWTLSLLFHLDTLRNRTASQRPAAGIILPASSPQDTSSRRQCPGPWHDSETGTEDCPRSSQGSRLQNQTGNCQAGAVKAEPGTAFARTKAEAGAFGRRDRGIPETAGPQQAGCCKGGRSGRRCASGLAGDPAGSGAWGSQWS